MWAKAEHVSKDAKRIYGSLISKTWLSGIVVNVFSQQKDGAKRATTMVTARYRVGSEEKTKDLPLQSLKDKDPSATVETSTSTVEGPTTGNGSPPRVLNSQANAAEATRNARESPTTTEATNNSVEQVSEEAVESPSGSENSASSGTSTSNTTAASSATGPTPVSVNHGREWFEGPTEVDVNGPVPFKFWKMIDQSTGKEFVPGCDSGVKKKYSAIDYFLACFPKDQLKAMHDLTNEKLHRDSKKKVTYGELLKWMGITILITRFEFGDRSSLWETTTKYKYITPAALGEKTGMSRDRYDELHRYIVWSYQPQVSSTGGVFAKTSWTDSMNTEEPTLLLQAVSASMSPLVAGTDLVDIGSTWVFHSMCPWIANQKTDARFKILRAVSLVLCYSSSW